MAKVHYVECPACQKEYYLDEILWDAILVNPKQRCVCPFCKKEFHLDGAKQPSAGVTPRDRSTEESCG